MIEDDDAVGRDAPFARSYDFFKHMTGVALVSIGGVFAFLDSGVDLDHKRVIVVLAFIGLAGVTSLLMAASLATLEVKPAPLAKVARNVRLASITASFFLAGGLGAFVQTFSTAILK
jgi:hypothetical protein